MIRDWSILRDIWKVLDPDSPIGKDSELTLATKEHHLRAQRRKLARQTARSVDMVKRLITRGLPIPKRLGYFEHQARLSLRNDEELD